MAEDPLAGWVKAIRETFEDVALDTKDAITKISEDAQYEIDKAVGRALAEHPELYAELRKTYRQAKKTFEKIGQDLGLL